MSGNGVWIAVEIEHAPHAFFELIEVRWRGNPAAQFQRVLPGQWCHPQPAWRSVESETTAVAASAQRLQPGDCTQGEVAVELLPVPGRLIGQKQRDDVHDWHPSATFAACQREGDFQTAARGHR